jgi:hypothetical protein
MDTIKANSHRRFNLDERREMCRVEVVDTVHSLGEVALESLH